MTPADQFLSSLDRSWKEFSGAWKKARMDASEKSIHHLRVSTRRLIATLELTRRLARRAEIPELQRGLKKVLKRIGPLRDVQVQLKTVSKLRQAGVVGEFKRTLERRERREVKDIRNELERRRKRRLREGARDLRSEFARLHEKAAPEKIQRSVEKTLNQCRNAFLKAYRQFQPADGESLHNMRIALKELRYSLEAAEPVLGRSVKARAREMQALQQLLGDTRDLELLRVVLEKWASRKGKKIAIAPALDILAEKRISLMQKIAESAAVFENIIPAEALKPASEKTHAVAAPAVDKDPAKTGRPRAAAG